MFREYWWVQWRKHFFPTMKFVNKERTHAWFWEMDTILSCNKSVLVPASPFPRGSRAEVMISFVLSHAKKLLCCRQHAWPNVLQNLAEVHATSLWSERENSKMVATDTNFIRHVWRRGPMKEVTGIRFFCLFFGCAGDHKYCHGDSVIKLNLWFCFYWYGCVL